MMQVSLLTLANICFRAANFDMNSTYNRKPLSCKNRTLTLSLHHFKER